MNPRWNRPALALAAVAIVTMTGLAIGFELRSSPAISPEQQPLPPLSTIEPVSYIVADLDGQASAAGGSQEFDLRPGQGAILSTKTPGDWQVQSISPEGIVDVADHAVTDGTSSGLLLSSLGKKGKATVVLKDTVRNWTMTYHLNVLGNPVTAPQD